MPAAAAADAPAPMPPQVFLARMVERGVTISVSEDGRLIVRGPAGWKTAKVDAYLKKQKPAVVAFLRGEIPHAPAEATEGKPAQNYAISSPEPTPKSQEVEAKNGGNLSTISPAPAEDPKPGAGAMPTVIYHPDPADFWRAYYRDKYGWTNTGAMAAGDVEQKGQ